MATLKHHEELDAWQLANELKLRVLAILERPAVQRHRNFCDDIDRSCRSGPANLAEAFWKYRPKEKAFLVRVAIGSLGETQNHLRDGRDRKYYEQAEFSEMWQLAKRAIGASIRWHEYLMSCPDTPPKPQTPGHTPGEESAETKRKGELKPKPKPKPKPKTKPKP